MLRAAFFDFDGTLQDFRGGYTRAFETAVEAAVRPACAAAGGGMRPEQVRLGCAPAWAEIWERFVAGRIGEDALWAEQAAAVLAAAGLQHDLALAGAVRDSYLAAFQAEVRLFPDAAPALAAVEAARPRPVLGLLTNGPGSVQRACLRRHGLQDRFEVVVISGEVGCAKPGAAFFAHALAEAGVRAAEAVMIGDHPAADVAGARAAGMRALWLNREGAAWPDGLAPGPDATVAGLSQAAAWVRQRLGPG